MRSEDSSSMVRSLTIEGVGGMRRRNASTKDLSELRRVSGSAPSSATVFDLRVHDSHVSRQCVVPTETLFFCTKLTPHLLLPGIMDGIFMPREIVRSAEDCVAGFSGRRIDPLAFVWTCLAIPHESGRNRLELHTTIVGDGRGTQGRRRGLTVTLAFVLLELRRSLEAEGASTISTCVCT
jgi:hypothetical protein